MSDFIKSSKEGLVLSLYIQPKASKNEITGMHGDSLKLRIKAPPVDGAANKACLKFIAKEIKQPPSNLSLISGQSSRQKQILIKTSAEDREKEALLREIKLLLKRP